jgi:hypothetical protein
MNDELKAMFSPLKPILIFGLIEFIILFCFTTSWQGAYPKTIKILKINDKDAFFYATEVYQSYALPIYTSSEVSSYGTGGESYETNNLNKESKIHLSIEEYEEYYMGMRTKNNAPNAIRNKNCDYKKVRSNDMQLKIFRKGKTIYDGPFINDITNIINEKGRYFIHIYLKRTPSFGTSIKTHISFNVIVDGGNYE